ncbi:MAG: hypothetical protein GF310_02395 [candidate division Zixibacteria bacterium]|nr:hypothetical protein [candidate division Zixibacteria bacterium]
MVFQSDEMNHFLYKKTGEIVMVSDSGFRAAEESEDEDPLTGEPLDHALAVLETDNYIALPGQFEINEYRMMEKFALSVTDQSNSDELYYALKGRGAFRFFKDTVWRLGLRDEWFKYRDSQYEELAIWWCEHNGIEYYREKKR